MKSYSIKDAFKELEMINDDAAQKPARFLEAVGTKRMPNIEKISGTIANVLSKHKEEINEIAFDSRKLKQLIINLLQSDEIKGEDNIKRAKKAILQIEPMRFPSQIYGFVATLMGAPKVNQTKDDMDESLNEAYQVKYYVYKLDPEWDYEEDEMIECFDSKDDAISFAKDQNYPAHVVQCIDDGEETEVIYSNIKKELKEDAFDIGAPEEVQAAMDIVDTNEEQPVEVVIDLEAENKEELKDSYVGDIILKCAVCQTLIYKSPEDVIYDEENPELCNLDQECPHCNSKDGFEAVGQVAPINKEDTTSEEETKDEENIQIENEPEVTDAEATEEEPEETSTEEFEDLDESLFDSLAEKYLNAVYENVETYKTTSATIDEENKIVLEGVIKFKSGKESKSKFKFESKGLSKKGKLKLVGMNESFSNSKKAFTILGKLDSKKYIPESLTYNYVIRNKELKEAKNIYGRVINVSKINERLIRNK